MLGLMNWKPKKEVSYDQLLNALCKYCSYQDRCVYEVEQKITQYETTNEEKEQLIDYLIEERFLDEDRFVKSYVKSKFNLKKWGRIKIAAHLRNKKITKNKIDWGLGFLDEEKYHETIAKLGQKKWDSLAFDEPFQRKAKTLRYLASKGFESENIYTFLETLS